MSIFFYKTFIEKVELLDKKSQGEPCGDEGWIKNDKHVSIYSKI